MATPAGSGATWRIWRSTRAGPTFAKRQEMQQKGTDPTRDRNQPQGAPYGSAIFKLTLSLRDIVIKPWLGLHGICKRYGRV